MNITENQYQETDLGNIAPNPKGEYSDSETYEYLDFVYYQGGSYLCLAELDNPITGISPEVNKTTEYWQIVALPGGLTPEFVSAHNNVVHLAEQVEESATEVRTAHQNVSSMKENVTQMQEQVRQYKESAEQSKESVDSSRQVVERSEQNVNDTVTRFDSHVEEKVSEVDSAIGIAKTNAISSIVKQQEDSVQEVKDQTSTYITEKKEEAESSINTVGETKKKEIEDTGTEKKNEVVEAITKKGAETLDSIPENYTALQGEVDELKGDLANLSYEREKYLSYSTEPKGLFKFFYRPVKKGTLLKIKINATTNTQYVIRLANSKDDAEYEDVIYTGITNTIYEVQNNWNGCVVWCSGGTLLEVDITICEKISNINSVILNDENLEVVEIKNKALSSLDMPTTRQIIDYDGSSIYVIEKTFKNMVNIKANTNIFRIGYANDIVNNGFVYECYDVDDDNSKVSCENDYKYIIVQCKSNYTVIATTVISKSDKISNALQLEKTENVSITKPANGIFYFYPCVISKGSVLTIKKSTTSDKSLYTVLWLTDGYRTEKDDDVEPISFHDNNEITYITKETWGGFTAWGTGDESENYEFDIEISQPYRPYKRVGNEVVICASNSDDKDKNIADFICDGVNDEVEINKAIEMMNHKVGTVTLCDGDYYIDKFSDYTISGATEKVAICMNKTESSGVTLTGCSSGKPQKAVIHLSESAFNDIPSDVTPSLIGGGSPSTGYIGGNGFNLKHVTISLPNANHKCIAVNYQHMYWGIIDSCSIYCDGYGQNVIPTDGLVGVRGWAGWSDGSVIGAYDTYVCGFRVGFQLGGEHVICERLGTRFCYTSYTFGEYPLDAGSGAQVHPITLINCCDEHQATLPKFYNSGNADSRNAGRCQVDFIGFNIEYYPLITGTPIVGAMEEVEGGWVGRIEYSTENNENNANVALPFWADGHGKNFRTLNTAQCQMGTTALRNTFAPNYMQQYYDTDLNKLVFCKDPSTNTWIDANGNIV